MSKLLDRSLLLQKEELEIVKVELDKGAHVFVRQMTGHEKDTFEKSILKETKDDKGLVIGFESDNEDFRAKLAVVTLCDEKGNLLLKPTDYKALSHSMSAGRLEKIVDEAQKLNKITPEAKELLIKNSDGDQVASSNSDSVEN